MLPLLVYHQWPHIKPACHVSLIKMKCTEEANVERWGEAGGCLGLSVQKAKDHTAGPELALSSNGNVSNLDAVSLITVN